MPSLVKNWRTIGKKKAAAAVVERRLEARPYRHDLERSATRKQFCAQPRSARSFAAGARHTNEVGQPTLKSKGPSVDFREISAERTHPFADERVIIGKYLSFRAWRGLIP